MTGWEFCAPLFPKTLVNGRRAYWEVLKRRRVNGRWQYREMTVAEGAEWQDLAAW